MPTAEQSGVETRLLKKKAWASYRVPRNQYQQLNYTNIYTESRPDDLENRLTRVCLKGVYGLAKHIFSSITKFLMNIYIFDGRRYITQIRAQQAVIKNTQEPVHHTLCILLF